MAEDYIDYPASCERTGLLMLSDRCKNRCLAFAKRCLSNPQSKDMFPLNRHSSLDIRNTEKYLVNFAHTENYLNSAVPYCQRLLNEDNRQNLQRTREREQRTTTAGRAPGQEGGEDRARQGGRDDYTLLYHLTLHTTVNDNPDGVYCSSFKNKTH